MMRRRALSDDEEEAEEEEEEQQLHSSYADDGLGYRGMKAAKRASWLLTFTLVVTCAMGLGIFLFSRGSAGNSESSTALRGHRGLPPAELGVSTGNAAPGTFMLNFYL